MVVIAETIEMMVTKVKKEKRMRRATTDVWLPYVKRNDTQGGLKKYHSVSYCKIMYDPCKDKK